MRELTTWLTKQRYILKLFFSVLLGLFLSILFSGTAPFISQGVAQQSSHYEQLDTLQQQEVQARNLYRYKQFPEAVSLWQVIAQGYAAQSNQLRQASALSNLALSYQAVGHWEEAQESIQNSLHLISELVAQQGETSATQPVLAQALMNSGSLQIDSGEPEAALDDWEEAERIYTELSNHVGKNRARINQAQALRALGFYKRSLQLLQQIATEIKDEPPSALKAITLRRLGDALRLSGQLSQAENELTQSLRIAQQLNVPSEISASLLSLGHTARIQKDFAEAQNLYAEALAALSATTNSTTTNSATTNNERPLDVTIPIQLAQLSLYIESEDWTAAAQLWPAIQTQFSQLPLSRTNIYHQINWATSALKLTRAKALVDTRRAANQPTTLKNHNRQTFSLETAITETSIKETSGTEPSLTEPLNLARPSRENIAQQLQKAVQQARQLEDMRAEAYGLGLLGQVYKQAEQWQASETLTQRALELSEHIQAPDIIYRWEWQLGKLWSQPNNPERSIDKALSIYQKAVDTLSSLRGDLAAADTQFSFTDNVEPVYREMVSLLLQTDPQSANYTKNLALAQDVIEALRVAELDNYFHEACADLQPIDKTQSDPHTALIYTIVLSDRLSLILNLPNQPPQHIKVPIPEREVTRITKRLRQELVTRSRRDYFTVAKQAYDFLIEPIRETLDASGVKTIVFVPDGPLQTVPLAALYDGDHFLIEDYAIGLTPSQKLINSNQWLTKHTVKSQRTLIGGLTEGREGFAPLPYVAKEIDSITQTIPQNSILLNEHFTKNALAERLKDRAYPIVHIATHGQFGSTPEETYLLTWNGRINVSEVSEMLQANLGGREGIELLILSACETAISDPKAGLGLAGVTVKAGAKSTLGTLWAVNDESTAHFVENFYQQLTQPDTTRAEALRKTQVELLQDPQYQHPIYWAPYILLGSWL